MTVATGELRIEVAETASVWVAQSLPYEVRDASHGLVLEGQLGKFEPIELPEGLYSVHVIAPDGRPFKQLVHIAAGSAPTVVGVRSDSARAPSATVPVSLLGTTECRLVEESDGRWTFEPEDPDTLPAHVPTAHFVVGATTWEVSLPLNPRAWKTGDVGCRVETVATHGSTLLEVRFADARQAATMLDGMIRHNLTVSHSYVVDDMASLLLNKFLDPAASALGGLTLHRLGRLRERQIWVETLSRDFPWIPDGRILHAALLMFEPEAEDRAAGLQMLLDATLDRPLYTDGLSLANTLLHHWPDVEDRAPLVDRLDDLADLSGAADWRAVALTTRTDPGVWD